MRAGLFAVALSILALSSASSQKTQNSAIKTVDQYIDSLTRKGSFSGTVLIARNDSVLLRRSYGYANVELGVRATDTTRYRLHSITKQFVAAAIMRLALDRELSLSDPIDRYLDSLPPAWRGITVEQLVQQSSGLPQDESKWFEAFQRYDIGSELDAWRKVASAVRTDTLVSVPGKAWQYNNFNYELLGAIIERVSKVRSLAQYLDSVIFTPAGMLHSGFDIRVEVEGANLGPQSIGGLATGYNGTPNQFFVAAPMMFGAKGAGGMYSTVDDLLRYDRALNRGTILPRAVVDSMQTRIFRVRPGAGYAYGWIVNDTPGQPRLVHHSGGNNGYTSEYARFPDQHLTIIILSNHGFADPEGMRKRIAEVLLPTG